MPINLALVGCGQIASAHIKAANALANTKLLFAIDSDLERARQTATDHDIPHFSTDYEQALIHPEVDAVLLCLPHDLHHPFALQAAAAGKHALVEKPMALDETEAQEMATAADAAGVQLSIGQSSRCIPAYEQTKTLLAQNAIGPLLNIIHQRTFWIDQLSTDWRRDQSACGGLYLPLFGSHDIDALLWQADDTPKRVWGSVAPPATYRKATATALSDLNWRAVPLPRSPTRPVAKETAPIPSSSAKPANSYSPAMLSISTATPSRSTAAKKPSPANSASSPKPCSKTAKSPSPAAQCSK